MTTKPKTATEMYLSTEWYDVPRRGRGGATPGRDHASILSNGKGNKSQSIALSFRDETRAHMADWHFFRPRIRWHDSGVLAAIMLIKSERDLKFRKYGDSRLQAHVPLSTTAPRPLAIGIFHDVRAAAPRIDAADLSAALTAYVRTDDYLKAMTARRAMRVSLSGEPVAAVSKEDAERARRMLGDGDRLRPATGANDIQIHRWAIDQGADAGADGVTSNGGSVRSQQ
jgi:hypothetical protein